MPCDHHVVVLIKILFAYVSCNGVAKSNFDLRHQQVTILFGWTRLSLTSDDTKVV